jgi:hypothetical protein
MESRTRYLSGIKMVSAPAPLFEVLVVALLGTMATIVVAHVMKYNQAGQTATASAELHNVQLAVSPANTE